MLHRQRLQNHTKPLHLCIDRGIARSSLVRVRLSAIIIRRWRVTVRCLRRIPCCWIRLLCAWHQRAIDCFLLCYPAGCTALGLYQNAYRHNNQYNPNHCPDNRVDLFVLFILLLIMAVPRRRIYVIRCFPRPNRVIRNHSTRAIRVKIFMITVLAPVIHLSRSRKPTALVRNIIMRMRDRSRARPILLALAILIL